MGWEEKGIREKRHDRQSVKKTEEGEREKKEEMKRRKKDPKLFFRQTMNGSLLFANFGVACGVVRYIGYERRIRYESRSGKTSVYTITFLS